jgi:hypothetical protein
MNVFFGPIDMHAYVNLVRIFYRMHNLNDVVSGSEAIKGQSRA